MSSGKRLILYWNFREDLLEEVTFTSGVEQLVGFVNMVMDVSTV